MTRIVTRAELERSLAQVLDGLAPGDEILIMDHGEMIGRLTAPGDRERSPSDAGQASGYSPDEFMAPPLVAPAFQRPKWSEAELAARAELLREHLKEAATRPLWTAPKWTREELYEDE